MKYDIRINAKKRVEYLGKTNDAGFISEGIPIPKYLLPVVNDHKGTINKDLEVILCSGQLWHLLKANEKSDLLELVEYVGQDAGDYVRRMESMYPMNPRRR